MALLKETPEQRLARERAEADAKAKAGDQTTWGPLGSLALLAGFAWYLWYPHSSTGTVYIRALQDNGGYVYSSHNIKVAPPDVVLYDGKPLDDCRVVDEKDWACVTGVGSVTWLGSIDGRLTGVAVVEPVAAQIGFLHYWLGHLGFLGAPYRQLPSGRQ